MDSLGGEDRLQHYLRVVVVDFNTQILYGSGSDDFAVFRSRNENDEFPQEMAIRKLH